MSDLQHEEAFDAPETEYSSVLLGHCMRVYDAMAEVADEDNVYTGALTSLFVDLGLGQPYYTAVTRKLKSMDCIRMMSRGGGAKPSKWMLLQEPSEALFGLPDSLNKVSTSSGSKQMMAQQLRDMNSRLLRIEDWARKNGYQ